MHQFINGIQILVRSGSLTKCDRYERLGTGVGKKMANDDDEHDDDDGDNDSNNEDSQPVALFFSCLMPSHFVTSAHTQHGT